MLILRKESLKVKIDLSKGSAYEYNSESEVPFIIKFKRIYGGRLERGKIKSFGNYQRIHDIVYMIKREYSIEDIKKHFQL